MNETRSFKTKLRITHHEQDEFLRKNANIYRKIYNKTMDVMYNNVIANTQDASKQFFKAHDLYPIMLEERKKDPVFREVGMGVFKGAVFTAHYSYLKRVEANESCIYRIPKYISRVKSVLRFRTEDKIQVFERHLIVPKIGKIKLYEKNYLPTDKELTNFTISFDGKSWWVTCAEVRTKLERAKEVSMNIENISNKEGSSDHTTEEATLFIDFNNDGNLILNGELLKNPIKEEGYQRVLFKHRKLTKQYRRQCKANQVCDETGKVSIRTSKNMLDNRKALKLTENKLEAICVTFFKRIAYEVGLLNPTEVHILSSVARSRERQAGLSLKQRQSRTLQFFDILCRKMEVMGIRMVRHSTAQEFQNIMKSMNLMSIESLRRYFNATDAVVLDGR